MGTNSIPTSALIALVAQLYHKLTAVLTAAPGATLAAIPRLLLALLAPPTAEVRTALVPPIEAVPADVFTPPVARVPPVTALPPTALVPPLAGTPPTALLLTPPAARLPPVVVVPPVVRVPPLTVSLTVSPPVATNDPPLGAIVDGVVPPTSPPEELERPPLVAAPVDEPRVVKPPTCISVSCPFELPEQTKT